MKRPRAASSAAAASRKEGLLARVRFQKEGRSTVSGGGTLPKEGTSSGALRTCATAATCASTLSGTSTGQFLQPAKRNSVRKISLRIARFSVDSRFMVIGFIDQTVFAG